MNTLKTGLLLAVLTALLMLVGHSLGGTQGMILFFGLAVVMNFASYWWSDKIVLGVYKAQPISRSDQPRLYGMVEELAQKAGLPMPRVYIIPSDSPNAFATGRNPDHAAVAVTAGIMRILDDNELRGVLAHEMSHVKNRDILIGTVAATVAGAISSIAWVVKWGAIFGGFGRSDDRGGLGALVMAIVAPIIALLIQMAISRSREFEADRSAGLLTGRPTDLASALQKLEAGVQRFPMREAGPATAHLFIANPFSAKGLGSLFSTHPSTEERLRKLYELQGELG